MELERRVSGFSSLFSHLFFKIKSPRCLLWGLLVSCVGAAVPEHRAGAVRLQPTSQGGKTLRNSSLAGSVRFCNGSRPDPGAGESGLTPKPGWAGAGVTHGDAAARGRPCPFVPCFGVGPSLFRGLDNPKNQRCRRERAGSETGPGVSEGGWGQCQGRSSPGVGICRRGEDSEPSVQGVLITKSLIIFSVRVVADSVRVVVFLIRDQSVGNCVVNTSQGQVWDLTAGPGPGEAAQPGMGSGIVLNSHICFPGLRS